MSDWPPDFTNPDFKNEEIEVDEIDLGEPVTDKLLVLLDELPDDDESSEPEVDLGEPVTDTLNSLLDQLPADWDSEESETEFAELVTDKLGIMLDELGDVEAEDLAATQPTVPRAVPSEPAAVAPVEDVGESASSGGLWAGVSRWFKSLFGG